MAAPGAAGSGASAGRRTSAWMSGPTYGQRRRQPTKAGEAAAGDSRMGPEVFAARVELLQWAAERGRALVDVDARRQGCPWADEVICFQAAGGGHLAILRSARAHGCPQDAALCMRLAEPHPTVAAWVER
eukprot:jgi/Tetstr1/433148/TSEL_022480.t1